MRLISWNVNGLRACLNKGFLAFCALADADVICLQETKIRSRRSLSWRAITDSGTAPTRPDIPARLFSPDGSRWR